MAPTESKAKQNPLGNPGSRIMPYKLDANQLSVYKFIGKEHQDIAAKKAYFMLVFFYVIYGVIWFYLVTYCGVWLQFLQKNYR